MNILGIETSCDETAAAIWQTTPGGGRILSEKIASQIDIHAKFGGVVPEIASREHLTTLPSLVDATLQDARLDWSAIDAIAVTAGPGLMGALLVGTVWARAAACVHNILLIPVHHMEGHLLAPGLDNALPPFPFITLLVSGGHTMLVRVDGIGHYTLLGQTIDDAAGECFDKSARLLALPYPGGPAIAKLAENGDATRFSLPRPMLNKDNLNFSFSGLKTAVMYAVRKLKNEEKQGELDTQTRADMAAAVEAAVCEVLVGKSLRACRNEGIGHLIIAGGVAANRHLRNMLDEQATAKNISVHMPRPEHCTDNAAMIAFAAAQRLAQGFTPPAEWDARPRWPLSELDKFLGKR